MCRISYTFSKKQIRVKRTLHYAVSFLLPKMIIIRINCYKKEIKIQADRGTMYLSLGRNLSVRNISYGKKSKDGEISDGRKERESGLQPMQSYARMLS